MYPKHRILIPRYCNLDFRLPIKDSTYFLISSGDAALLGPTDILLEGFEENMRIAAILRIINIKLSLLNIIGYRKKYIILSGDNTNTEEIPSKFVIKLGMQTIFL